MTLWASLWRRQHRGGAGPAAVIRALIMGLMLPGGSANVGTGAADLLQLGPCHFRGRGSDGSAVAGEAAGEAAPLRRHRRDGASAPSPPTPTRRACTGRRPPG